MTERLSGHAPSKAYTDGRIPALRATMAAPRNSLHGKHIKVLDALREALPENGVVCSDMTQIAYTGIHHFPCSQARSWFHPSGFGTLGWALPAAIGAKLAAPERPVVALVGDGGFLFTAPEIGVAVEHGLPVVVVLWNNDGLGQIRDDMIEKGMAEVGVNPTNPDYIKLAEAFGCRAVRPDSLDGFRTALRDGFAADGPTLIEMRQDAPFLDE